MFNYEISTSEYRRLQRRRKIVNRRLKALYKNNLDDIPSVNSFRGALGGFDYISEIPRDISRKEYEDLMTITDKIFNDPHTTLSGAKAFKKGREKMISDMLKHSKGFREEEYKGKTSYEKFIDDLTRNIMLYIPYEDFKYFKVEYDYEHILEISAQMIDAKMDYDKEYMSIALASTVAMAVVQYFEDNNVFTDEELQNKRQYYWASKVEEGYTVGDIVDTIKNLRAKGEFI